MGMFIVLGSLLSNMFPYFLIEKNSNPDTNLINVDFFCQTWGEFEWLFVDTDNVVKPTCIGEVNSLKISFFS